MAFDTLAVACLAAELKETILGGRIDKIYQPERDEILLSIRTFSSHYRLVLSANASYPRAHLTQVQKENPQTPPMFCMLLRKHLAGGKVAGIRQPAGERVLCIDVESYNELGDLTVKHLILELMGRHSNLILTNAEMQVIDSVKHVDFTVSSVRQIMPGLAYQAPPPQNKTPVLSEAADQVCFDFSQPGQRADKAIMAAVSGISPVVAREAVYQAAGRADCLCADLSPDEKSVAAQYIRALRHQPFRPCLITDAAAGKVIDFSAVEIRQYGAAAQVEYGHTLNEILERYFRTKDAGERMKQKSASLVKLLHINLERLAKKLVIQKNTLDDAKNKDLYKIYGDLLTANLYQIADKSKAVTLQNFYAEDLAPVTIQLDPARTPAQNAQRYYKLYNKAKNAGVEVARQVENTTAEIDYLESTLMVVEDCQSESELNAVRQELSQEGYLKRRNTSAKARQQVSAAKPMHFVSSDGFDIYVGRNNTQNDYLTLRFANSQDLWFHTKKIHGSHAVIKLGLNKDIPPRTLTEAATLAAYFSKARHSSQVPVDYTTVKNVRKPNGAKPGMVIYDHYNTIYVTPALLDLEKKD